MAQRYKDPTSLERMADGKCPECGNGPEAHSNDDRFWMRSGCDLTGIGVMDRIAQYVKDLSPSENNRPGEVPMDEERG